MEWIRLDISYTQFELTNFAIALKEAYYMNFGKIVFAQIMLLIPRRKFNEIVAKYIGNYIERILIFCSPNPYLFIHPQKINVIIFLFNPTNYFELICEKLARRRLQPYTRKCDFHFLPPNIWGIYLLQKRRIKIHRTRLIKLNRTTIRVSLNTPKYGLIKNIYTSIWKPKITIVPFDKNLTEERLPVFINLVISEQTDKTKYVPENPLIINRMG